MRGDKDDIFWRRAFAALVDFTTLTAASALVAVAAYAPSGGLIRSTSPVWARQTCENQGVVIVCRTLIFGVETDRQARTTDQVYRSHPVVRYSSSGGMVQTISAAPIDQSGAPRRALYLDWFDGAAALAIFTAMQAGFGGTFGQLIFGVRVASTSRDQLGLRPALFRNLLVWGWWPLFSLVSTRPSPIFVGTGEGLDITASGYLLAFVWLLTIAAFDNAPDGSFVDVLSGTRLTRRPS